MAQWVLKRYELPTTALSALGKSGGFWCLKVPARSGKPEHLLLFTEGAPQNLEFTLRVAGKGINQPDLPKKLIADLITQWEIAKDNEVDEFHQMPLGGVQPFPWTTPRQGSSSAILVSDPVLQHPERKFLCLCGVTPEMDLVTNTLPNREVVPVLATVMPEYIIHLDNPPGPEDPSLAAALAQLAENSPQKLSLDGLTLELRLRQHGRCLDMVVGPRWLGSILQPVEAMFGSRARKVLPGTNLLCINDSQTGAVQIRNHDDQERPVGEGLASFFVHELHFANPQTQQHVHPGPAEALKFATLSEAELYEKHGLIRQIQVELRAPRSMLGRWLLDAQEKLRDHDFNENPAVVFDYSGHFQRTPGNFAWSQQKLGPIPDLGPQQFRLVVASLAFFENEVAISDAGEIITV